MLSIVLVGLFHGGLYASSLPPWGLVDEEQHVHYIQSLAERQEIPVVGTTFLSQDIVDSLFETRRWEVFHWPTPQSPDPRTWGLEGHSYEGYQPPLFYALFAPVFALWPGDLLDKVYALRWTIVGLSLLTVWMVYRLTAELFPRQKWLSYLACLLLVVLPERVASVSRVNNDVLLEVIATAYCWACTRAALQGLSARRSYLMGLLLGLGVLSKTSMAVLIVLIPCVFWINRRQSNWLSYVLRTSAAAAIIILPLVARNLWLYRDLTGFAAYRSISGVAVPVAVTGQSLAGGLWDLFRHFWVVWWKGAAAATNPVLTGFYIVLAVSSGLGLLGLVRYLRSQESRQDARSRQVIVMYMLAIVMCAGAVMVSYFDGSVPVIQGRFLLPVIGPTVIVLCYGLWRAPYRKLVLVATLGSLVVVGALSLFGNLLPYFYYWSAFVRDGVPQPYTPLGWQDAWTLFSSRFSSDKPNGLPGALTWVRPLYLAALTSAVTLMIRMYRARSDAT